MALIEGYIFLKKTIFKALTYNMSITVDGSQVLFESNSIKFKFQHRVACSNAVDDEDAVNLESMKAYYANRKTKELAIGFWDMDTDAISPSISHGLSATEYKTLVIEGVTIWDDAEVIGYGLMIAPDNTIGGSLDQVTSTAISFNRVGAGYFDNANFDDGAINRGNVVISYIPD
jgi:hypothetical protein